MNPSRGMADKPAAEPFCLDALPVMAWKNGGGVTRELVCLPAGADLDHFDWRVSIADIARSGPFSRFAGIDRCIVLLEGDGVLLHSEQGWQQALTTPGEPFHFAGEAPCQATLLGTASRDFNVMTRRGRVRAGVTSLTAEPLATVATVTSGGLPGVWLVLQGAWQDDAGQRWLPGSGLLWRQPGSRPVHWQAQDATARLLQVSIHAVVTEQ